MVYAVHRHYIKKKISGGRIVPCRIKTYVNDGGQIQTILKESGNKNEVSSRTHRIFHKLEDAIVAITTKKKR